MDAAPTVAFFLSLLTVANVVETACFCSIIVDDGALTIEKDVLYWESTKSIDKKIVISAYLYLFSLNWVMVHFDGWFLKMMNSQLDTK